MNKEWETEPDRVEFEYKGYPCLINRHPDLRFLCGYVGMPPGHPWHGKGYHEIEENVDVHGGLTYSNKCRCPICHVPEPGKPDDVWWLGFDCGHAWDFAPFKLDHPLFGETRCGYETYRNIEYVRKEIEGLVEQAIQKELAKMSVLEPATMLGILQQF